MVISRLPVELVHNAEKVPAGIEPLIESGASHAESLAQH